MGLGFPPIGMARCTIIDFRATSPHMSNTSPYSRRFRLFCIAEGISWVFLIGGMVVKYGMGKPEAVRVPGLVHGVLFIGYMVTAVPMFTMLKWAGERIYGVVAAGFLPFGTVVLERKWLRGS